MGFLNAFGVLGRFLIVAAIAFVAVALVVSGDARIAFLVIALSIGITGLVFAGVGSRLGKLSAMTKQLRTSGVTGKATITSLRETGVAINNSPVIEFSLEVETTAHAPYSKTIRQRAPRLLVGTFPPGSVVSVLVDPSNRDRLAIDWEAGTEQVAPGALSEAEDPAPTALLRGGVRDLEDLLHTGRPASAMITSMEDAGDMSELGLVEIGRPGDDDRLFIIGLEVKQAGLDPYEVRIAHRVPERLVGRVGPRTRIGVAVDRDNNHAVAIDWDSIGH